MQSALKDFISPALNLAKENKAAIDVCEKSLREQIIDTEFYDTLTNISNNVQAIKEYILPKLGQIRPNKLNALCDDIVDSIDRFKNKKIEDMPYPVFTFENELKATIHGLYDALEFIFVIFPDEEKLENYYKERDERCIKARALDVKKELAKIQKEYEVTIVIMTFNLLDYFKQCFESILKYTNFEKYKVKLVVFDHGSKDETLQYLEQYNHLKFLRVFHLKENIKNELSFVTRKTNWYDTKYTMIIANDTIATQNYLDNLMNCIQSDDRIAWICPAMSNTSVNQTIPIDYKTIVEMHEFAEKHNHSQPGKWEELSRLIPVFSMYNNVCRRAIGHEDFGYFEFFYGDDDLSRSFIRSGFRMLVCKDTYIHHYPSLTVNTGDDVNERMFAMREYFYRKFNYDAWDAQQLHYYFPLEELLEKRVNLKILFIEPTMGAAVQHLRTIMHKKNIPLNNIEVHSASKHRKYKLDMEGYSAKAKVVSEYEELSEIYEEEVFDAIVIPEMLEDLWTDNYVSLFLTLRKLLKANGRVFFGFKNVNFWESIFNTIASEKASWPENFNTIDIKPTCHLKLDQVKSILVQTKFSDINFGGITLEAQTREQELAYELILKVQKMLSAEEQTNSSKILFYIFFAKK